LGIKTIEDSEELKETYQRGKELHLNINKILGFGTIRNFEAFISDYYKGTGHSLNMLMHKGECLFFNVCDVIDDSKKFNMHIEEECVFPSRVFAHEYGYYLY